MAKTMKTTSLVSILLTICLCFLYQRTANKALLPFAITCGTIAYHFTIRLLVGGVLNAIMKNKADYTKRWFHVSQTEMKFYQTLRVRQWKNKMPTYDKDTFDASKHSWEELIQAMCQSELVHEINAILSFLPVAAAIWFDAVGVFIVTSVLSAVFDLMFVFMQRFNRFRILNLRAKQSLFSSSGSG